MELLNASDIEMLMDSLSALEKQREPRELPGSKIMSAIKFSAPREIQKESSFLEAVEEFKRQIAEEYQKDTIEFKIFQENIVLLKAKLIDMKNESAVKDLTESVKREDNP